MACPTTREKIISASIDLFADMGYANTSLRDIAAKVGIQASSIYNHFPSKDAILLELFEIYRSVADYHVEKIGAGQPYPDAITVESLSGRLFFAFPEENSEVYIKILKIIFTEQSRNELIRAYVKDEIVSKSYQYIKSQLDYLTGENLIPKTDTVRAATTLYSIVLSYAMMATIQVNFMDEGHKDKTDMFSTLAYVLGLILAGKF